MKELFDNLISSFRALMLGLTPEVAGMQVFVWGRPRPQVSALWSVVGLALYAADQSRRARRLKGKALKRAEERIQALHARLGARLELGRTLGLLPTSWDETTLLEVVEGLRAPVAGEDELAKEIRLWAKAHGAEETRPLEGVQPENQVRLVLAALAAAEACEPSSGKNEAQAYVWAARILRKAALKAPEAVVQTAAKGDLRGILALCGKDATEFLNGWLETTRQLALEVVQTASSLEEHYETHYGDGDRDKDSHDPFETPLGPLH